MSPVLPLPPALRAQKKAEREAMLRSQFEEKRAERVQKYQVSLGCSPLGSTGGIMLVA
jgi:hypothetical protein